MKFHLFLISPSCFGSTKSLETTIKMLERFFRHSIIANSDGFLGHLVKNYGALLDRNRVKDLELLLLMYSKDGRILEINYQENEAIDSSCAMNNVLHEKGFTILYSKEKLNPLAPNPCKEYCFMKEKYDFPDIFDFLNQYRIPPSQEIRLEKGIDITWLNENIYIPILTSSSTVHIIDPFIGRNFVELTKWDIIPERWNDEGNWIYSIVNFYNIFKERSIFEKNKHFRISTAVRIDEEKIALKTANEFKKHYLKDPNISTTITFYIYERSHNPPDEFPHDRYILTNHAGINLGVGFDVIDPDNNTIRRESQLTFVGQKTRISVLSQLRNLPSQDKKRRIIRKKTINGK